MKRAIGVAALGGGLLAFSAGAASAQETSADVSARIGRSTSAQVRVCSDGRMLSRLVGSCDQGGSSGSVQAGAGSDQSAAARARVRVPRVASADVSVGVRRSRPQVAGAGQATITPRAETARADANAAADTSPQGRAGATAGLSRSGRLLAVESLASLAGVGLLGSSPFTLAGDPASDSLLPSGSLTPAGPSPALDLLTGSTPAPAGIGVLGSGPIASGNQVGADAGDSSPTVPLTVCGNSAGVLGDASASCGANQETSTDGTTAPPTSQTGTTGTTGTPGQTSTTGTTGTTGLTPGSSGGPAGAIPAFAPLRPLVSAGRALPFTGAASDLLAAAAVLLLAAGVLFLRAARPAAVTEGGDR